jgi:hypothetical protein
VGLRGKLAIADRRPETIGVRNLSGFGSADGFPLQRSAVILDEYHFEPEDTKIGILLQTIAT